MKKLLFAIFLVSFAGCTPSNDNKVTPPSAPSAATIRKQKEQNKARVAAQAKLELARKQKAKVEELAAKKRIAKEKRDAERAERRIMRIVRRELPSYEKAGMKWRAILIRPNSSNSDMAKLAQKLHDEDPTGNFHFLDDDSLYEQYMAWDINYPDSNYPYPEEWADKHIVGMLNKMGGEWQLGDGMGQRIAPLTG